MDRPFKNILKLLLIIFFKYAHVSSQSYNLGMCADPECSIPVALGITTISYSPPDRSKLGFPPNQEVIVFVRDYGVKKDLLGVEFNGEKGYVPKSFVKETKSLAKATVPANLEFMLTPSRTLVYHETSHFHSLPNHPTGEVQSFSHTGVPTNLNPQQSVQFAQHSEVHLESSRPNDHIHFQASSNIYIAKNADSRNYFPPSEDINYQSPHIVHPSHSNFESGNLMSSNFIPKSEMMGNSDNSIQFHQTNSLQSQWQNPSSQIHSQPNMAHGVLNHNTGPNLDPQSNYLPDSQGFDFQSNILHQTHVPDTALQQKSQDQMLMQTQTQSNLPPENNHENLYDETWSLLQNRGLNRAGEFTNEFSNQHHSEKESNSFQNQHSGNVGHNTNSLNEKHSLQSGHVQSLVSDQTSLEFSDISQMEKSHLAENIRISPSEAIASRQSRASVVGKRFAETLNEIFQQEENSLENESDEQIGVENNKIKQEDVDTDSSKPIETPVLEKSELKSQDSEQINQETLTTENKFHNSESLASKKQLSNSTIPPTTSENELLSNNSITNSDIPDKEIESNHEKIVETIGENLNNISSNEVENSNDDSLDKTLEPDSIEISLQEKENKSHDNADLSSDFKDLISESHEDAVHNIESIFNVTDSSSLSDDNSQPGSLLNVSDIKEPESNILNAYQTRHLKDVESDADSFSSTEKTEQTGSNYEFDIYVAVENMFVAMRTFVDALLPWIPEPLYTMIMDLEKDGVSPKVTVFTVISAFPCIILIVLLVFVKGKSKENQLNARLTTLERNYYNITAEKNILEEKLEKTEVELQISKGVIEEEKILFFKLKTEVESLKQHLEGTTLELEKNVDEADTLKGREQEYIDLIHDHEKEHLKLMEQKGEAETKALELEETLDILRDSLRDKEEEIQKLIVEKAEYRQANEMFEEKVSQLQKNCSQLLQEAEVWDLRVKELTEKLIKESVKNEELEKSLQEKAIEIESLSEAVQMFKTFEEIGGTDNDECKTSEEKLKYLKNSTHNHMKLQKQEEENRLLAERLSEAKCRLLDIEVSIMDVKSENDKLKVNYNQALQDKAEAVTKLEVLTNYFKDKEIQMQRQLGVQEAVRQKTEEDASSAERRICLIEQENSSYKYQVASMKQEIEETERNLKSQIALQEKKAHENWLAARTAERKLEDTKQEVMQLRQRLTLLEREQENWANSTRDEIIRPVPKRIGNLNDDSINTQDSNNSLELRPNVFPPLPPMLLPPDRPLPPLPPLPPPFLPPYEPPPFRPQPWNMPPPDPLSNSDFRMTPSDYGRGRESTPPRGRNSALVDGELGPRQSSPIADLKDSRNSTPPHLLPDFHDIPPHPGRPFYPPPPMGPRTRYPMPPRFPPTNFRRDYPGPRRIDNQEENNSYGTQNASPDDWNNSNTRV